MMREIRKRLLTRLWVVLARVGAIGGAFVLELSPIGLDKGCGKSEVSEVEISLSEGWRKGAEGKSKT